MFYSFVGGCIITQFFAIAMMIFCWKLIPASLKKWMYQHKSAALAPLWGCTFAVAVAVDSFVQAIIVATTTILLGYVFLKIAAIHSSQRFPSPEKTPL